MPNHITNTLEIYAWHDNHPELMEEIKEYLCPLISKQSIIDFDAIIPEDFDDAGDWYGWRCENWGTKWNAYNQDVVTEDLYSYRIQFDTAWSPPEPVIARIRGELEKRYPMEKGYETHVAGAWIEEGYQSAGVF